MKKKHLLIAGVLTMMVTAICVGCTDKKDNGDKEKPWNTGIKTEMGVASAGGTFVNPGGRVGVHDPSIEYDPATKQWYIFGSHTDFAKSNNLINWTKFSQGNGGKYGQIFAECAKWSAHGSSNYNIGGNLWAPDVIYNHDMKKWCMYMSINGDKHFSSIALATADSIEGPYTYVGTIVYSGFATEAQVAETDYEKVTGEKVPAARYLDGTGKWSSSYGTNAIDPCVLYDKDGQLWMVYGSWFGGTFMLKLDNETGLRDYTYTYEHDPDGSDGVSSDPYLGKRISGGYGGTGEGPYIVWDEKAGYYYLYLSYCGLEATTSFSGYHMRLFRSENIDGPYVDASGDYAIRTKASDNQAMKGIKIMGNYFFSSLSSGNAKAGYKSPGHNSAIVDDEGNRYVIYHTRFNTGTEVHQVRVHQQFLNEDGWLVTAPYEYLGSKLSETGYDEAEIVGVYELIDHGTTNPSGVVAPMLETLEVELHADHTITGDMTGTWEQKAGSCYATLVIDGVTYKGVFFKQFDESSKHEETMTFTVIGSNDIALWGSRDALAGVDDNGELLGNYDFADKSNVGKDSAGKLGDATVVGAATLIEDEKRGTVLNLDGLDAYLELPKTVVGHEGFTFMTWFRTDNVKDGERLFEIGDDSFTYMYLTSDNGANKIRFAYNLDGEGECEIVGDKTIKNTWTHVAVTINSQTNRAELYVNGEKIDKTMVYGATENFQGLQCYIGKSSDNNISLFAGCLDDVYIFDYALNAEEIAEYMNK